MQREETAAFLYTNQYFEYCIWCLDKFIVGHYIDEDPLLTYSMSLITKYKIEKVIVSTEINIEKYMLLKDQCAVEISDLKNDVIKNKSFQFKSLDFLRIYLEMEEFKEIQCREDEPMSKIGYCGKYPVYSNDQSRFVFIDKITIGDLNLINTPYTSLFDKINHTGTLFGESVLKNWLLNPLNDLSCILERQTLIDTVGKAVSKDLFDGIKPFRERNNINISKLIPFLQKSIKFSRPQHTKLNLTIQLIK